MGTQGRTVTIQPTVHRDLVAEKRRSGKSIYRLIADAFAIYMSLTPAEREARLVKQKKAG